MTSEAQWQEPPGHLGPEALTRLREFASVVERHRDEVLEGIAEVLKRAEEDQHVERELLALAHAIHNAHTDLEVACGAVGEGAVDRVRRWAQFN